MVECLEIEENKRLRVIVIRNNEELIIWDFTLKEDENKSSTLEDAEHQW